MGNGNSIEDQQEGQPNNRSQAERGICFSSAPAYAPVAEEKGSRIKKKMVDLSKEMTQLWDAIRPLAKQNNPPVADIAAAVTTRETSLLKSRENEAIVRLHIEQMEDLRLAKALGQKGFREYVKCRVNPPENRKQARLDRLNRCSREPGGASAAEVFPGLIEEINQVDVASDPQGAVHRLAETVLASEDRLRGRNELTELQKEQMRFMETEHVKPLLGGLFPVFQNVKSSIGRIRRLEQENTDRGADYSGATSREEQHKILKDLEIELTSETFPRHDEYAFVRAVSYTEARLRGNKPLSPLLREQLHEIEDRIIRGQKLSKDSFKLYWKAKWPGLAFRTEAGPSQLAREDQMQVLAYLEKQIQDVKVTAENAGQALAVLHQAVKSAQDRLQQLSGSRVNELAKLQILEIEERVIRPKLGGDGYRSYKEKQDTGSRFAKEQDVLIRQLRETADDLQTKLRSKDLRDQTVVERLAKQVLTTRSELEALSEIKDSRNLDALLESEERDFKGRFPQHVWQEYEKKKAGMLSQYQSAFVVLDNEIEKRLQSVTVIEAVAVDLVVAANACKQALRSMGLYLEQAHRRIIGLRIKSRVADSVVYKKFEELARLAEQFDETARKDEEERLKRFSERSNGTPVMLLDPNAPRDAPRAEEGADPGSSFYFIYCCGSQNPNTRTATLREMEQDSNNRLFWIDCSKTDKKHSVVMQLMDGDKKTPIAITDPFPLEPMPVSVSHNIRMQGPKVRPSTLTYKGTVDATRDFDPKTGQPYSMQVNRRAMRKLFGEVVN